MRQAGAGRYADTGNPNITSQMLHSAQRPINSAPMLSQFPGRPDSFRTEDEYQYISPKSQAQWQWERDESRRPDSLSRAYIDGQGNDASQSSYQTQWLETRQSMGKTINPDSNVAPQEQGMNARYKESSLPQTFEGLEQKFLEEIVKLNKEQQDAEDAENARHRERLNEINSQHQEKLLVMRSRQSARRDEFLRKESHARHQEYQQVHLNSYQKNAGASNFHGFAVTSSDADADAAAAALGEAHRAYGGPPHADPFRDRPQFSAPPHDRGFDSRGPYPGGRAYNSGGRRF